MTRIGIESHIQLNTKSKIFCSCATFGNEVPNTRTCQTCLGMPGSKPVFNKEVLIKALKVAIALNCKIASEMFFSRKSYFYPDMSKNFQISQYEIPLATEGKLDQIKIRRIHLEEDPAKLVHEGNITLVDYNRSGIPLIEVVTEPDFKNTNEVRIFLQELTTILEYLGVYERKSEATIKTDANISLEGHERVEVKNITGIKDIERALNYEVIRQQGLVKTGQTISRETRAWDPVTKTTRLLRTKETEEDYAFIFEPDLTKIEISKDLMNKVKKEIPELPRARALRFIKQYKINEIDAKILTSDILLADLYEEVSKKVSSQLAAKWLRRELLRVLNYNKKTLVDTDLKAEHMIQLLSLIETKKITEQVAQKMLNELIVKPFSPEEYVKKEKIQRIVNEKELTEICKNVLKENPQAIKDYKAGEKKAFHYLLGKVMEITKGAASPDIINKIMRKLL